MGGARRVMAVVVLATAAVGAGVSSAWGAPTCMGREATIVGTEGDDSIAGVDSPGADVIVTFGGDDTVLAGGGDDVVCTGSGEDWVHGMRGKDRVSTGFGNDTATGGYDTDSLWLGPGHDVYDGDAGGSINHLDTIYAGAGRDRIHSNLDSPMKVFGGRGGDTITAFSLWSDTIRGEGGADTIDVRDFIYYDGVYEQSTNADDVDAGPQPAGTQDVCVVNTNDTVQNCESVDEFDDT